MDIQELSNVSSSLAIMGDPALQQFAQSHKSDPYMVSLALNESNRRKAVRNAKQAQGGAPQGKVVDQSIAGMSPTPVMTGAGVPLQTGYGGHVQTELPENQGIGRLPAPNMRHMADGGIAGYPDDVEFMSGGGVPGYADFGSVSQPFEAAFQKTLGYEGGYVEDDAGKGESNFGINKSANPDVDVKGLTKDQARALYKKRYWDAIGGDDLAAKNPALATVAFDTAVNMGVSKANQLVAQSKGDPLALLGMRQQHYDKLIENNPKKFAPYAKGWKDRVADLATSIIPSAQAGEVPSAARPDAASQIPGHSIQAPAKETPGGFLSSDWFQERAANLGLPRDVGRQVSTTLSAPTPLDALAMVLPKQGGMLSGIARLGEKAAEKMGLLKTPGLDKEAIAALQRERQGIASLEAAQKTAQEAEAAAEAARMSGAMSGEANLAAQGVEAASSAEKAAQAAKVPSAAERIARTSEAREAAHLNDVQNAARAMEGTQRAVQGTAIADTVMNRGPNAAEKPMVKADPNVYDREDMEEGAAKFELPEPDKIVKAAKEATPAKERKGFDDEDMLTLGLQLLAGKNPKFLGALGEAGLGTLAAKKAREKAETEKELVQAHREYYTGAGKKAEAEAADLAAGTKFDTQRTQLALNNIERAYEKWLASPEAVNATTETKNAEMQRLAKMYYPFAGLEIPSTMNTPPPNSQIKVLGSRPQ